MRIFRTIVILLTLTFAVIFVMENMHPVPLYLPILKGCNLRLIFILLGSYILGAVTTLGIVTSVGATLKKKRKLEEMEEDHKELFDEG
jgi:uncharacterized integral membrane protein